MINVNLEVDDEVVNFNLPQSWDEITIEDFIKLFSLDRDNLNEVQLAVKALTSLTDINEDVFYMMEIKDFEKLAETLKFISTDLKPVNVDYVEIGDEVYYLKKDFSKYTMGEVISIETILQSADNNLFKVMDKLLCIFLRKKKENGKLETFKNEFMDRSEIFKKAPVSKVYNVFSFFLSGEITSSHNIPQSSQVKGKQKK